MADNRVISLYQLFVLLILLLSRSLRFRVGRIFYFLSSYSRGLERLPRFSPVSAKLALSEPVNRWHVRRKYNTSLSLSTRDEGVSVVQGASRQSGTDDRFRTRRSWMLRCSEGCHDQKNHGECGEYLVILNHLRSDRDLKFRENHW